MRITIVSQLSAVFPSSNGEMAHLKIRWADSVATTATLDVPTAKLPDVPIGTWVIAKGRAAVSRWEGEDGTFNGQMRLLEPHVFVIPPVSEWGGTTVSVTDMMDHRRKETVTLLPEEDGLLLSPSIKGAAEGILIPTSAPDEKGARQWEIVEQGKLGPRRVRVYLRGEESEPRPGDYVLVEGTPTVRVYRKTSFWTLMQATIRSL